MLFLAPSARAERPKDAATLTYLPSPTTAGACPAAEFLALEVEIRLGYELFRRSAPNHLTVAVERVNGQFRAVGQMRDATGKVVFTEAHLERECTAVVVDMAMAVALELTRPLEDLEPSSPASSAPSLTAVACSPARAATVSPPPPRAPLPRPYRLQMGIASVFSIGTAPSVVGGLGWLFGVRWPNVEVAVEARALIAPSAEIDTFRARRGYRYLYAAISGSGCYHKAWVFGCARVEVGSLTITNTHIILDPSEAALLGVGLRFGAEKILTPGLAIKVYADVFAEMLKPNFFRTDGALAAWDAPRISAAVGVGPVLSWGD